MRTGHSAGAGASGATPPQHGALRMALEIVRREGAHGLYAGLPPALLRHIMYTGEGAAGHLGWAGLDSHMRIERSQRGKQSILPFHLLLRKQRCGDGTSL